MGRVTRVQGRYMHAEVGYHRYLGKEVERKIQTNYVFLMTTWDSISRETTQLLHHFFQNWYHFLSIQMSLFITISGLFFWNCLVSSSLSTKAKPKRCDLPLVFSSVSHISCSPDDNLSQFSTSILRSSLKGRKTSSCVSSVLFWHELVWMSLLDRVYLWLRDSYHKTPYRH